MIQETIVDYKELARILKISPESLKKNWRKYPHFFPLSGTDLRGARFDVADVMKFLKDKNYEQTIEVHNESRGEISGQIYAPGNSSRQRRIQSNCGSASVGEAGATPSGSKRTNEGNSCSTEFDTREDKFDLLRLVK